MNILGGFDVLIYQVWIDTIGKFVLSKAINLIACTLHIA